MNQLCCLITNTVVFMRRTNVFPFDNPIEFKEINHDDFEGYEFEDVGKTIIEPNEQGYISDVLKEKVNLETNNTTVINAGVGQGKTKAVIDFIKWYYETTKNNEDKFKVIVVTPFKTLNKEYRDKIHKAVGEDNLCFDYQELNAKVDEELDYPEFYSKPVQLISVMSILGDPGTVAFKQSNIKRKYYEYLIEKCTLNKEKVILIFDELHESLESFTPDLMPNLLKWKGVVYKAIIASATFTESSKVPIKFIAELTERKLKIIESERVQSTHNLSELHLCFYNQHTLNPEHQFLKDLVQLQLETASTVNILCYSKNIANELYNGSIGTMLREQYGSVTLCTGEEENTFDHESCNIGTRFKTGVSIEKENSAYFVVLPLRFAYTGQNTEHLGIFTDRINSLVQGLARPRKKSKIFVITPSPTKLITRVTDKRDYIDRLSLGYLGFQDEDYQSRYYSLRQQEMFLKRHYGEVRNTIETQINEMEGLSDDIKTIYSSFDWFRLKDGDRYLHTQFDAYGKNLTNYLYWAAWNNQFVNCRLTSVIKIRTLKFNEGNIQSELDVYFPLSVFNENTFADYHDKHLYLQLRNTLFSNNLYYRKNGEVDYNKIEPKRTLVFEQQIIHFIQRRKTPYLFEPSYGCVYSTILGEKPVDASISKSTYFRSSIGHSVSYTDVYDALTESEELLITAYNGLLEFQEILLNSYSILQDDGTYFLPLDSNVILEKLHSIKLKAIFTNIKEHDVGMVAFNVNNLSEDKGIYKLLREMFYENSQTTKTIDGEVVKCWKVNRIRDINSSEYPLNLVYNVYDPFLDMPVNPEKSKTEETGDVLEEVSLIDIDPDMFVFDYYETTKENIKRDKLF